MLVEQNESNNIKDCVPIINLPTASDDVQKIPKKRGRKPKGGKIVQALTNYDNKALSVQNVILHLKCGADDLKNNDIFSLKNYEYHPCDNVKIDSYQFAGGDAKFELFNNSSANKPQFNNDSESDTVNDDLISHKLKMLAHDLHTNNLSDKRSACFLCTYEFDNPPIYIPKHVINGTYHVYGCFCSPECAAGHLFKQSDIDPSSKFERYTLLNHIYCKIYNYEKNIKPAPDPHYTLNKFYGSLTIQEYRHLLKNERLLLIVDKPLIRSLPELHIDNDDFVINNKNAGGKFKLKTSNKKQTKTEILNNTFKINNSIV